MPQPAKELDPGASSKAWFGAEVRHWRTSAKLSIQQLAAKVLVSREVVRRIEHGTYTCRRDTACSLDRALSAHGVLIRGWEHAFAPKNPDADDNSSSEHPPSVVDLCYGGENGPVAEAVDLPMAPGLPAADRGPDDNQTPIKPGGRGGGSSILVSPTPTDQEDVVKRRSFLAVPSLAALAAAPGASRALITTEPARLPTQIHEHDIAGIQDAADYIFILDNRHGGDGIVRQTGTAAMVWAEDLLSVKCAPELRDKLFAAVAHLAINVGASAFDAYAHNDARRAFRFAAVCAEEVRQWHLRAKAYSFLARQAVWIGAPDDGLTFAEIGLARADRLTATEQAMLHTARARAFAKMGRVQQTLSAVGEADDAFAHTCPEDDPPWMLYYDEAQHHGDTGHALYDLALAGHDPTRAERRLSRAVAGHTPQYARSRAISRTKLASLLMATDDPDHAAEVGHVALGEVGSLHSRRAADDVRALGRLASRRPRNPQAAALREHIAAVLPS